MPILTELTAKSTVALVAAATATSLPFLEPSAPVALTQGVIDAAGAASEWLVDAVRVFLGPEFWQSLAGDLADGSNATTTF